METRRFTRRRKDITRTRGLWIAVVPILVALFIGILQAPGNFHQSLASVYADTGSRASEDSDGITFPVGADRVTAQRQGDWVDGSATFCLLEVPTGAPWQFLSDAGVDHCLSFTSRVPGMVSALEAQYRPSGTWDFGGIPMSDAVFRLRLVGDGNPMKTQWRVSVISLSGKVSGDYPVEISAQQDSSGKWFWMGAANTEALKIGDLKTGDFVSFSASSITLAREMGPSSDARITVQGTFAMGWEESSFSMPTSLTIAREGTGKDREYILTGTLAPTLESRICLPDTEVARGVCINLSPEYEIKVENRASDISTLFRSVKDMKVSTLTDVDLGPAVGQILSDLNIQGVPAAGVYFENGKLGIEIPIDQEIALPENDPDGLTGVFRTLKVAYDVSSNQAEVVGDLLVDLPTALYADDGGKGLVAALVYRGSNIIMNIQPPNAGLTLLNGTLRVEEMGWEQVEGAATLFKVTGQLHVEDPNTGDYLDVDVDNMVIMVAPFPMIFVDNLSASGQLLGFGAGIENAQFPFPYEVFAGDNRPIAGPGAGVPVGLYVGNIWLESEDPVWKELIGEPSGVLATGSFSSPQLMLPRLGEDPFSGENLPGTMFRIIFAITGETEGRLDLNVPGLATGAGYRIDSTGVLVNGRLSVSGDISANFAIGGMLGPDSYQLSGQGMMGILGAQADTTVRINEKGFKFQLVGDVYGQFEATIKVNGEDIEESNGVDVYAAMKGEFLSYFQETLLAQVREDLAAINGDLTQAQADVEYAQGEVDKIIEEIERLRRLVQAERDRDLESAREDLATAQAGVSYAQKQVNRISDVIRSKEGQRDRLRNRKSCTTIRYWVPTPKWYDLGAGYWKSKRVCVPDPGAQAQAVALDAEITALYADLAVKKTALSAVQEILKVAQDALRAYEAEINKVPVDLDPRLVAKFAERDAATVAIDVSREVLKVAQDGTRTVTEAVELAQMVKIKSASFEGKLGTLTGSKVTLKAEVVVNDQPKTVAVDFNFKDVPGSTAALLAKLVEA